MPTLGLLSIIVGIWFIRQVAVGRVKDIRTDTRDALDALVCNGDIKSVMARKGSNVSPFAETPGGGNSAAGGAVTSVNGLNNVGSNVGGAVLREAQRLGAAANNRYVFGATGPNSYDCSGLVWRAMYNVGVYRGVRFTTYTFPVIAARGVARKVSSPAVGDIVLWTGHMGIVSGANQMYNAASSKSGIRTSSISGHGGTPSYWRLIDGTSRATYSQN